MKIKLFGTEIYISFLFAAVLAFMLATDRTGYILHALFAVLAHETGHLFAMWVTDCSPRQIKLIPASVRIVRGFVGKPSGEMFIALSGPAVNLVLFGTLYINYLSFGNETVYISAGVNLLIAVFNMLPVNGLDGGTVLYLALRRFMPENRAALGLRITTGVAAMSAVIAAGYFIAVGSFNPSMLIIALYFLIMTLMKI